ncbi:hypothetical protein TrVE_jg6591 [Triparma verrucosa]|uniref:CXXC-type domain-containing protein n=1 Tax=Triparma verrucosa TaxID=1606542 RepID=A0A9W7DKE8_9STRA|nr:hypothetical protein TrVE_jg6591 [Triparma verrucosa]
MPTTPPSPVNGASSSAPVNNTASVDEEPPAAPPKNQGGEKPPKNTAVTADKPTPRSSTKKRRSGSKSRLKFGKSTSRGRSPGPKASASRLLVKDFRNDMVVRTVDGRDATVTGKNVPWIILKDNSTGDEIKKRPTDLTIVGGRSDLMESSDGDESSDDESTARSKPTARSSAKSRDRSPKPSKSSPHRSKPPTKETLLGTDFSPGDTAVTKDGDNVKIAYRNYTWINFEYLDGEKKGHKGKLRREGFKSLAKRESTPESEDEPDDEPEEAEPDKPKTNDFLPDDTAVTNDDENVKITGRNGIWITFKYLDGKKKGREGKLRASGFKSVKTSGDTTEADKADKAPRKKRGRPKKNSGDTTEADEAEEAPQKKQKGPSRMSSCRKCKNCRRKSCGECSNCLNPNWKQRCKYRTCLKKAKRT